MNMRAAAAAAAIGPRRMTRGWRDERQCAIVDERKAAVADNDRGLQRSSCCGALKGISVHGRLDRAAAAAALAFISPTNLSRGTRECAAAVAVFITVGRHEPA